jgi:hypothetical protein
MHITVQNTYSIKNGLGKFTEKKTQIKLIELGFITLEPILDGGNIDMISLKNNIFNFL